MEKSTENLMNTGLLYSGSCCLWRRRYPISVDFDATTEGAEFLSSSNPFDATCCMEKNW